VTGDSAAKDITTLRLPGIGWLLQWRRDGFWRELNEIQHQSEFDGSHVPERDEWVRWSGLLQPQARGGEWGGVATWWLIYGELPGSMTPSVVLADGTRPPVLLLGRLWACEWRAVAQMATVHVEGERFDLPFFEPFYLRQDPADTAQSPASPSNDSGWFGVLPPGDFLR
jgi:hypothetical protein